jgi:hypothetical protein
MAMQIATAELASTAASIDTSTDNHPPLSATEQRRRARDALRERLARHLAGVDTAQASNFESMVLVLSRDPSNGPAPCEDCGGDGFRQLAPHVIAEYDEKLEHRLNELEGLTAQLRTAEQEAQRPRRMDEVEDKIREHAAEDVRRLDVEIIRLKERMEEGKLGRRERMKRAICRSCRGSGQSKRRRGQGENRPDSLFNTVTCVACRGRDTRSHPRFLHRHLGSSTGTVRMRGNRLAEDGVTIISDPRDDRAAELGDVCATCRGDDGMGTGYVFPVTVRPILKTSNVQEDAEGIADLPEGFPDDDFTPRGAAAPDWAETFLDELRKHDPAIAAAVAAHVGSNGDTWSVHAWDRRFALWPLTADGRRVAEESKQFDPRRASYAALLELCAFERLEVVQAGPVPENARRRALIGSADIQARMLETRVDRALDAALDARATSR